jgi:hypothetical protein
LLKAELQFFHHAFQALGWNTRFFAGSAQAVQKFAPAECFTISIALDHRDWNGFHPFVSGEAEFAIKAFPATSHAPASIGSS